MRRLSLALARLNFKKQYIEDVGSREFLDVLCLYNKRALAFTGFGRFEYKKQYIEDVVSIAFLDASAFTGYARADYKNTTSKTSFQVHFWMCFFLQ